MYWLKIKILTNIDYNTYLGANILGMLNVLVTFMLVNISKFD